MRADWVVCDFNTIIDNISTANYKIKQKDYISDGQIPVVDQGQELIGGYYNQNDNIIPVELPVIVFGDHTKCLKFINFNFIPGADGTKVLKVNKLIFDKFIYYILKVLVFKIQDKGYARHFQFLQKEEIPLPPLPEQRAIVKKIEALFSSLDAGIADLKKAQEQLKIYRQAVLKKAFEGELTKEWRKKQTDLPSAEELLKQIEEEREKYYNQQIEDWKHAVTLWEENGKEGIKPKKLTKIDLSKNDFLDSEILPSSWKLVQISEVLKFLTDYHANGGYEILRDNVELLDEQDYALMIRATNFEKKDFTHDVKYISESAYNFLSKTKLYGGEILFGKIGNAGRSYLMPYLNRSCSLAMNLFSLTTYINNKYLFYHLKNNKQIGEVNSYVKGVGNPTIDKKSIRSIHISLCSLEEQSQIVKEIEARLSVCDAVEKQIQDSLAQAEALRQSILKKAFEGRLLSEEELTLCKQAPDYEPASVLLAKIKAEKEANKPMKKKISKKKL